jgi:type I restriction enzyme S subunit
MMNKRIDIPQDWSFTKLGNLGEFLKGKGVAKKEILDNGIPCVRYGEIYTIHHEYIKEFHSFINKTSTEDSFKLEKGDLLFAGSGEKLEDIGKCVAFLNDFNVYAGGDIVVLRNHQQNAMFMGFLLNTPVFRRQAHKLGQGHSVVHIYSSGLKNVKIPIPPLPEQQKIAAILRTWDKAIDKLTQLIAAKEQHKKGLMQQLLTGKKRFAGFTDDWKDYKLTQLVKYFGGAAFKSSDKVVDGLKWLKIANVGVGAIKWGETEFLPKEFKTSFERYYLLVGDVVIALTRPILSGKLKIAQIKSKNDESLLNQRVAKLIPYDKNDVNYLYYLHQLDRVIYLIESTIAGTDPPNISVNDMSLIKVKVPQLEEQQKIASVLLAADKEIELLKNELESLQQQKKGLMQVLLTGKVRVRI